MKKKPPEKSKTAKIELFEKRRKRKAEKDRRQERMLGLVDKGRIIGMKQAGMSNREISRTTGHGRKKISEVWQEYCVQVSRLGEAGADAREIQEEMNRKPKYDSSKRKPWKLTEEVKKKMEEIVEEEGRKTKRLGKGHKQKLTNQQIHEMLIEAGHEIGRVSVNTELAKMRKRQKEAYIRQEYDFGDRLEYDFGVVKLNCGSGVKEYHMAVFSSPASNFTWAYLYTNEKQGVFLDSHVKFFEMTGGAWKEVVYDNMKNVVHKFIGRTEKELNPELIRMGTYYGYQINVTNCFKGNEKGHVENSVKMLRNKIFAPKDTFASLEEAREYMESRLIKLNERDGCKIEEEKQALLPYRPPLELAAISEATVSPYAFISVDTCFYSVPEHLVGSKVVVKKYHDEIRVYANNEFVCKHARIFGNGNIKADIHHYLNTLLKKPGAIKNSAALKSIPRLKAIFDTHYSTQPKRFIEIFIENKHKSIEEIIEVFEEKSNNKVELIALEIIKPPTKMEVALRTVMARYTALINMEVKANDANKNPNIGVETASDTFSAKTFPHSPCKIVQIYNIFAGECGNVF